MNRIADNLLTDDFTVIVFVFSLRDGIAFGDALAKRGGRDGLRHALHFHLGRDVPEPFLKLGQGGGCPKQRQRHDEEQ